MKYFSLPADFRQETLDKYDNLHKKYPDSKILSTYGNISIGNIFGSGRDLKKIPSVNLEGLEKYIKYSKTKNIQFAYTLNAATIQNREFTKKGISDLKVFLGDLYSIGVRSLIISIPSLIEVVKIINPDIIIKASVICQITNANKAEFFKKMGADFIVVDESINRDFNKIAAIRKSFGENVEVIVNSICHQDCQYKMFHYNQIAEDSINQTNDISSNYYTFKCIERLYDDIASFFRLSWIRPEDLKNYTNIGIKYFKIQGRQAVLTGNPARAAEAYIREKYSGDLKELLLLFSDLPILISVDNGKLDNFIKYFIKNNGCSRNCQECLYCDQYAKKVFGDSEMIARIKETRLKMHNSNALIRMLRDEDQT